jgi:hypothetical protein
VAAGLRLVLHSGRIGAWHIGQWVDWRRRAIRIKFDSVEDGKLSEHVVRLALQGAGPLVTTEAMVGQISEKSMHGRAVGDMDF